jgi:hypothetical protein
MRGTVGAELLPEGKGKIGYMVLYLWSDFQARSGILMWYRETEVRSIKLVDLYC